MANEMSGNMQMIKWYDNWMNNDDERMKQWKFVLIFFVERIIM